VGSIVQVGGASHLGANHSGMFETSFLGITSTLYPAHAACCRWGAPLATAGVLHTQVSRNALINTLPVKLYPSAAFQGRCTRMHSIVRAMPVAKIVKDRWKSLFRCHMVHYNFHVVQLDVEVHMVQFISVVRGKGCMKIAVAWQNLSRYVLCTGTSFMRIHAATGP
jgi:hypothetical protein